MSRVDIIAKQLLLGRTCDTCRWILLRDNTASPYFIRPNEDMKEAIEYDERIKERRKKVTKLFHGNDRG